MHHFHCRYLTPSQRICKYPLLLKDLLKATPEDDPDYANIAEALKSVQLLGTESSLCFLRPVVTVGAVDKINERTRRVDNAKKIEDIQNSLEKKPKDFDLQTDLNRWHIREGLARVSSGKKSEAKELYLYLFSDMLLITKRSKDKCSVRGLPRPSASVPLLTVPAPAVCKAHAHSCHASNGRARVDDRHRRHPRAAVRPRRPAPALPA